MDFAIPRRHAIGDTSYLPESGTTTFTLPDLSPGTSGRITGLADDGVGDVLVKHLRSLGFILDRIAAPLRRVLMGGPMIYRISDYELCLCRQEARFIRVIAVEAENCIVLQSRPTGRHATSDPETPGTGKIL